MTNANDLSRLRCLQLSLAVLNELSDGLLHTKADLSNVLGCCERTALRHMKALDAAGFYIERDLLGRRTVYQLVNPQPARDLLAKRRVA
jgi:biotin operon repressor